MKNAIRIILALVLTFVMIFSFSACDKEDTSSIKDPTLTATNSSGKADAQDSAANDNTETSEDLVKAEIVIKNYGTIKLDLYADEAPKTVANFVKLAKSGFYNGLTFHRIMEDFMMQGGDPLGNGTGGSDDEVVGEFSANGHTNNISHIRGTISMARSGSGYEQYLSMGYKLSDLPAEAQSDLKRAYNSGSSQFFICHKDSVFLDGNYAAFGRVTDGIDVVDAVCEDANPTDNNGTISKAEQPVIETIKIVE
ncbi:MAG: peptidylprolyl isomerase [Clostridia bacterium]|nr:peptidylprolyl isomerase [Clostridia bacterium]